MSAVTFAPAIDQPYRQSCDEVLASLAAEPNFDLSRAEVERLQARYGRNELDTARARPEWLNLLAQFTDMLVLWLREAGKRLPGSRDSVARQRRERASKGSDA